MAGLLKGQSGVTASRGGLKGVAGHERATAIWIALPVFEAEMLLWHCEAIHNAMQ